MANTNRNLAARRRMRVRNKIKRVATGRPRLSVFRSNKNIYAQVIDDVQGITVASASTMEADLKGNLTVDVAAKVGAAVAERAKSKGVEEVYFDRGSYLFHGRVKALADAAREAGLKF
jgi:large subunit ribosomal protein L18